MDVELTLSPIRCANPACESVRNGRPRVLMLARLTPGSVVESTRCRACGWHTRLSVDERGRRHYSVCLPSAMLERAVDPPAAVNLST